VGPIFLFETVNSRIYVQDILGPFLEQLPNEESMSVSSKMVQLHILQTTQSERYKVFDDRISIVASKAI
jgi:hypothetical protein